jgi:hypothetical protein
MRTTVTLDPDVESMLRKEMRRRGEPFKQVLNNAIRAGLRDRKRHGETFEPRNFDMGKPRLDLTRPRLLVSWRTTSSSVGIGAADDSPGCQRQLRRRPLRRRPCRHPAGGLRAKVLQSDAGVGANTDHDELITAAQAGDLPTRPHQKSVHKDPLRHQVQCEDTTIRCGPLLVTLLAGMAEFERDLICAVRPNGAPTNGTPRGLVPRHVLPVE